MGEWQIIQTHVWTRLTGHDVEVRHEAGHNVPVRVVNNAVETQDGTDVTLRPPGGFMPPDYVAPLTGTYRFGCPDTREPDTTTEVTWITREYLTGHFDEPWCYCAQCRLERPCPECIRAEAWNQARGEADHG